MIILDLLKLFARIPARNGVLDIFANGHSSLNGYLDLQNYIHGLPEPLIPEIGSFVFGQSLEAVKQRINKVRGTYLFVDFGEFESSRNRQNSIEDRQRVAVTVAKKMGSSSDIIEEVLASDQCLGLINKVRACLLAQQIPWLKLLSEQHSIIPLESKELSSVGWTLIFDITASDWFDLKLEISSFQKKM